MSFMQLLQPPAPSPKEVEALGRPATNVSIEALRLIELTGRTSAVMRGSEAEDLMRRDTLVSVLGMFGRLNRINVTSSLSVVPYDNFPGTIASHAREVSADLIILPWSAALPATGDAVSPAVAASDSSPFDSLFGKSGGPSSGETSVVYSQLIRQVFSQSSSASDVALLVGRPGSTAATEQHLLVPFFGGPDDRLALALVVQLCTSRPSVSATVIRVRKEERDSSTDTVDTVDEVKANFTVHSVSSYIVPYRVVSSYIYRRLDSLIRYTRTRRPRRVSRPRQQTISSGRA